MNRFIRIFVILAISTVALAACRERSNVQIELPRIAKMALYDSTSYYYGYFKDYPQKLSDLPIGVFDIEESASSIAILDKLQTMDKFDNITGERVEDHLADFAGEHIQYLCSNANISNTGDYALKNAIFLTSGNCSSGDKRRVKIIISSGNISNATGINDVSSLLEASGTGVKIISAPVEAVEGLLDTLSANSISAPISVGILASESTLSSRIYQTIIDELTTSRGIRQKINLIQGQLFRDSTGAPMIETSFVYLVERCKADKGMPPIYACIIENSFSDETANALKNITKELRNVRQNGSYPYRNAILENIVLINPAEYAAIEAYRTLRTDKNLALRITEQEVEYFTDNQEHITD